MKEVILCKYGEIILKGANKASFESLLLREVRRRAAHIGHYTVRHMQSTVYIEPEDEEAEASIDRMVEQVRRVFGFAGICRAAVCEKDIDVICRTAAEYVRAPLASAATFRAEARRSDKRFPLPSPEIAARVGEAIIESMPAIKVDLTHPDVTVQIEVRDRAAYIHMLQDGGAGGIPIGSGGRGLLLLSGGIDSPVAGYMMMKRGLIVDALHFESFPYTSEMARDKVIRLARHLTEYSGRMRLHVISLTHVQEGLRARIREEYFTLLLRRVMMKLASRCAESCSCPVLITGESLGQVASQTLRAICVTEQAASLPVLRPCIGLDKEEIIRISRAIGTFETSILPYEDCCTVFTPRHPKTQPELSKVMQEEEKLDLDGLLEEAWAGHYTMMIDQFDPS